MSPRTPTSPAVPRSVSRADLDHPLGAVDRRGSGRQPALSSRPAERRVPAPQVHDAQPSADPSASSSAGSSITSFGFDTPRGVPAIALQHPRRS